MIRKLSLILAISILISSFVIAPVSASDEKGGSNIDFLRALSIVPPEAEIDGESVVTRIELAKMYYRIIMQTEEAEAYIDYTSYTDVSEDVGGVVQLLAGAGLMRGISDTEFGSNQGVTYIQLLKTMVAFLGYGNRADYFGGYPMGYYSVAASLGIIGDAPSDMNMLVTYNGVANMFRNAVDADVLKRIVYDIEEYEIQEGTTYLELYYGIKIAKGIVTSNNITDLDGGMPPRFGRIKLNGVLMMLGEFAAPLMNMVGQSAKIFYAPDSENMIFWFEETTNSVVEIRGKDITRTSDNSIFYEKNNRETSVRISAATKIVYNNTIALSYSDSTLNPFVNHGVSGGLKCVDNNNDGVYDIVFINAYETMTVGAIRDGHAFSKIRTGIDIDFSGFAEDTVAVINALKEPISPNDIAVGDVLNYYKDLDGKITTVIVTIDSGSGVVTEIESGANGIIGIVMSDRFFELASSAKDCPDIDKIKPGDEVTVFYNIDQEICDIVKSVSADDVIGLLIDYEKAKGLDSKYRVKIMNTAGAFKIFTLADKITINNEMRNADAFAGMAGLGADGRIIRQVIKYSATDEKLTKAYFADNSKDAAGLNTGELFVMDGFDGKTSQGFRTELVTFGLKAYVTGTKVFVIPPEADRDNEKGYAVKNGAGFFSNASYTITGYGTNKYSPLMTAATYESATAAAGDLSNTSNIMLVGEIVQTINEDEDIVYKVSGYARYNSSNEFVSFEVEELTGLNVGPGNTLVESGDIIKFAVNSSTQITKAELLFDKSENRLHNINNPSEKPYPVSGQRFVYGDVVYSDGKYITIEAVDIDGSKTYESYIISRFTSNGATYTCATNNSEGTITKTVEEDIFDRESYGASCSKAFVHIGGSWWTSSVIFND